MLFCWDFFFSGKEGHVCLVQPVCRSRPTIKPWCSWQDIGRHDRRTVLIELWFVLFPWIRHQNLWSLYMHPMTVSIILSLYGLDVLSFWQTYYFHQSANIFTLSTANLLIWNVLLYDMLQIVVYIFHLVCIICKRPLLCTVTEFMWLDCQIQFTWLFTILVVKKMVLLVVQGKKIISKNLFVFHMSYWL